MRPDISIKATLRSIILTLIMSTYAASVWGINLRLPVEGSVIIEYISSKAAFINTLAVSSPNVTVAEPFGIPASNCALATLGRPVGVRMLSGNQSQQGCRILLDASARRPGIQVFSPTGFFLEFSLCSQETASRGCKFIWSSNPSKNIDHFDHVRISLIGEPTELEERIFLLEWEDSPQGGDMDFDDLVVRVSVRPCAAQP